MVISSKKEYSAESQPDELELPLFDFDTLAMATNNFSDENKLGQGGFGCVYKVNFLFQILPCINKNNIFIMHPISDPGEIICGNTRLGWLKAKI